MSIGGMQVVVGDNRGSINLGMNIFTPLHALYSISFRNN